MYAEERLPVSACVCNSCGFLLNQTLLCSSLNLNTETWVMSLDSNYYVRQSQPALSYFPALVSPTDDTVAGHLLNKPFPQCLIAVWQSISLSLFRLSFLVQQLHLEKRCSCFLQGALSGKVMDGAAPKHFMVSLVLKCSSIIIGH